MSASSWKRVANFIDQQLAPTQNTQATATANSQQLESLLLSHLSVDDSGPLQVNYGLDRPLACIKHTMCPINPRYYGRIYRTLPANHPRYDKLIIPYHYG